MLRLRSTFYLFGQWHFFLKDEVKSSWIWWVGIPKLFSSKKQVSTLPALTELTLLSSLGHICMFHFVCLTSAQRLSSDCRLLRSVLTYGHGSLSRLPGSVCVCAVQTLRCCRVHQRLDCQLSSSFPPGETLRGPPQKGHPPPTGGHAEA